MPREKRRRARTGCVRRRPLREEQEQYRHSHGLHTNDVTLRHCFHAQMASADLATISLCTNISNLLAYSTLVHTGSVEHNSILEEVRILRDMQQTVIQPLEDHYFEQESILCDVPDDLHEMDHNYGPPRNRTIASLSDYDALHYTNYTKNQLFRIYRCFNFGHHPIRLHCSQGNYYRFDPQYIFLFGLVKMSTGLDNIKLCDLVFGGSPRRMSNAFKYYCLWLKDRYYDTVVGY